jgi:hypothetical protein
MRWQRTPENTEQMQTRHESHRLLERAKKSNRRAESRSFPHDSSGFSGGRYLREFVSHETFAASTNSFRD